MARCNQITTPWSRFFFGVAMSVFSGGYAVFIPCGNGLIVDVHGHDSKVNHGDQINAPIFAWPQYICK